VSSDQTALLKQVRDEVWHLTASPLYTFRKKNNYYPVLGEGNHSAKIMFIGEAPGKNEAEPGKPFCGAAGKVLDELLEAVGLHRKDVYVTNIVKDRPPENRDPLPNEISVYGPFLDRQIDIIQPKIIATLGRFSMNYILRKFDVPQKDETISRLHGQLLPAHASYGEIHLLPLYHPAVALYNTSTKDTLIKDFEVIKNIV
jgi:DNA polymerase